ncbi:MAG: hypothetical protein EP298_13300 [Gammaproteobacteria bacterium]|nr:MAG: hypothetical protein EP298_13300 [Gammaproteobacteria bacterium]UTW41745.1 hypothetical protein KFE69_09535 [bacterium SCSIO 12844]
MINYLTELPEEKKAIFECFDMAFLKEKNFSLNSIDLIGCEVSKVKYHQFAFEVFLLFHNIEIYGLEAYKELYESFFKRLMVKWIVVLPLGLEIVTELKDQFKDKLYQQILSIENISVPIIYKQWLRHWDDWIVKHRLIFIETINKQFQFN